MQIQELINLAHNKLARLNERLMIEIGQANLIEIENLEKEITETNETLDKLRSL